MGNLQDGGLVANNPSSVALTEVYHLSSNRLPDYAASFGTGRFLQSSNDSPASLVPGWLQRMGRCLWQHLDADLAYNRFSLDLSPQEHARHYRINPSFSCQPIPLDDASAMSQLQQMTRTQMLHDTTLTSHVQHFCRDVVARLFYPVITSPPVYDKHTSLHYVELEIVSRWEDDMSVRTRLLDYLQGVAVFLVQGQQYEPMTPLHLTVAASTLEEELLVELAFEDDTRYHISGLPFPIGQISMLQSRKTHHHSKKRRCTETTSQQCKRPKRCR